MSRSYKKEPIRGYTTARSEKGDKKSAHKKFRVKSRASQESDYSDMPVFMEEVSNVWAFSKDGKQYWDKYNNPYTNKNVPAEDLKDAYKWYSK